MKLRRGDVAIVTGASRGLGTYIARALAGRGVNLVLTARSVGALEQIRGELLDLGVDSLAVPTDVRNVEALEVLVTSAVRRFGTIDVLVNNAGIEYAINFDQISVEQIRQMVDVNLTAPMVLSRLVIPAMIHKGRGHIVNIASAAGVMSSAYEEPYIATKHGLVGFTRSLRLTAQDLKWPISASVICPGFMDGAGMYESMKRDYGVTAPSIMGSLSAEQLGHATIRAIERDLPDVMLMKGAPRLSVALSALAPRLYELVAARLDVSSPFRAMAASHLAERKKKPR